MRRSPVRIRRVAPENRPPGRFFIFLPGIPHPTPTPRGLTFPAPLSILDVAWHFSNTPHSPDSPTPSFQPATKAPASSLAALWRALSHPAWLTSLAILTLLLLVVHLWVPQLPTSLTRNPIAATAWLDATAATLPAGTWLRALGLLDLAHAASVRLLLPLFAAFLAIHLTNDLYLFWQSRHLAPPTHWLPGLRIWEATFPAIPSDLDWQEVFHAICQRVSREDDGGDVDLWYGDCHHRWQIATLLREIGLGLLLLTLLLNLYSGWQIDPIILDPGETISLTPYTNHQVGFSEDGQTITLCCPQISASVAQGHLRADSLLLRVTHQNQALKVRLEQQNQPLTLQAIEDRNQNGTELILHFPEARSERAFAAPQVERVFRIVALGQGQFQIQALDASNQVLLSQTISGPAQLALDDHPILFLNPTTYLILRVQSRPWTWLLLPAAILFLAGYAIRRWRRYCRLALRTNHTAAAIRIQTPGRPPASCTDPLSRLTPPSPLASP